MKKIYAVRKGRIPGIYGKWKDCENQVSGYPKAEFKAFEYQDDSDYEAVRKLAQDYIDGKDEVQTSAKGHIHDYDDYEKKEGVYQEDIIAFVDGSNKDGVTSYAAIIYHNGSLEYFEAQVIDDLGMSQAAGEYAAAAAAIDYCTAEKYDRMLLVFDHREIGSFCLGEHKPRTANKYGVDLVEKYNHAVKHMTIELIWTHSHQSNAKVDKDFLLLGNEAADKLANFVRDYKSLCSRYEEEYALVKLNFARIFDYMYNCPIRKEVEALDEELPFSDEDIDDYFDPARTGKFISHETIDAVSVIRKYVPQYGIVKNNSITMDTFLYVYMHSISLEIKKEFYSINAIYTLLFVFMDKRYLHDVLSKAILGSAKVQLTMDEDELEQKKHDVDIIYDHIITTSDYLALYRHFVQLVVPEYDIDKGNSEGLIVYSELMQQIWAELLQRNEDSYRNGTSKTNINNNTVIARWISHGGLTLNHFYRSITGNPDLCKQLKDFQGSFVNPDFEGVKTICEKRESKDLAILVSNTEALRENLRNHIIGQDAAVMKFVDSYFNSEIRFQSENKKKAPKNTVLFAGTPGVGKTYLAETFAEYSKLPYKRFDMSGFSHRESYHQFVGFAKTWKDSRPGILTTYVKDHPECVLLFDEIEKADQSVIHLFLQILDGGELYDEYREEKVSFAKTTIIFTTNAGHSLYEGKEDEDLSLLSNQVIIDGLLKDINPATQAPYFPPEIASRLASNTIIMFNHLSADNIKNVMDSNAKKCIEENEKQFNFTIEECYGLIPTMLYHNGGKSDARNASKSFQKFLNKELLGLLQMIMKEEGSAAVNALSRVKFGIDLYGAEKEVLALYDDCEDGERFKENCEYMALRHQYLNFETIYDYDYDNAEAIITLYDLKLDIAITSDDQDEIVSPDAKPNVHWDDIVVEKDIKEELQYFVDYLSHPKEYIKKGGRAPRGVLMYGPAGTGKTSLAKVVATESDVVFINADAASLRNMGTAGVHRLFYLARKYSPSVVFIDEVDAIGANREMYGASPVLNALLTEMDGFSKDEKRPVFVMAATNLGSDIDPALVRRFDRTICIDVPSEENRIVILKKMIEKHGDLFQNVSEAEIESIAKRSAGMSPSKLENMIEAAIRDSIRRNEPISDDMFDEAFEKCKYGDVVTVSTAEDMLHTARHEVGHALMELTNGKYPVFICVVSRANFGGYLLQEEQKHFHVTRDDLLGWIRTALGGRAAEMEYYGQSGITTGSSSDLEKATKIARAMVTKYGMYEEEMGLQVIDDAEYENNVTAKELVNKILSQQLAEARQIVRDNKEASDRIVAALLQSKNKYLTQTELKKAFLGE